MNTEQLKQLENDLWSAADNLRANTDLKSTEYAPPILGLIFLKFAENNYLRKEKEILAEFNKLKGSRREKPISEIAIEKCGFHLPDRARYNYLLNLSGDQNVAKAIKEAMEDIAKYKPELDGVLPVDAYTPLTRTDKTVPAELLKTFSDIPSDASGDMLGKIYEYFLGKFALAEGQGGGEFFTPTSVVRLMVEIIEPYSGKVYDPACGSGGMFVQSQQFIDQHRKELKEQGEKHDEDQIFVYGQEKTGDTVKLAKMNLAVNGLKGEIKQANSYSEDPFDGFGKFDYVMANPPFNVDDVPIATVESDERFNTYGIPRNKTKAKKSEQAKETVTNANYLWINLFATSLKAKGRAALVMANSASDAGHSEADIRQKLIENNLIYGMLTLPSNMFFTVTLPATLWFFDKDKKDDKILFIDARNVFTQIDRAHREFNQEQIQNLALISKLHKGQQIPFIRLIDSYFANGMERLIENQKQVVPVSEKLVAALEDKQGKNAVSDLMQQWAEFKNLQKSYQDYLKKHQTKKISSNGVKDRNEAQHLLRENFDSFFVALHDGLKEIDKIVRQHEKTKAEAEKKADKRSSVDQKTKQLKLSLEQLHNEVRGAEGYYKHIKWLQDRFPKAKYEDVIGLCKLATPSEVKDQGYSLNSGRYIGVVIEEDGKTEEEFIAELTSLNDDLSEANIFSQKIVKVINNNISKLAGPQ